MLHSKTAAKCKRKGQRPKAVGNGVQGRGVSMQPHILTDQLTLFQPRGQTWTTALVPPLRFSDLLTALGPERHLVSGHIEAVGNGRLCTHLRLLPGPSKIK